jgi:hypothetical protein
MDLDPSGDKDNHNLVVPVAITDPIHQSSPESDSKGNKEVYMMGVGRGTP